MDEKLNERAEITEVEGAELEVTELDDNALEDVAGGPKEIIADDGGWTC